MVSCHDEINNHQKVLADDEEQRTLAIGYLNVVLNVETMNDAQATALIRGCLDKLLTQPDGQVPPELTATVRTTILR